MVGKKHDFLQCFFELELLVMTVLLLFLIVGPLSNSRAVERLQIAIPDVNEISSKINDQKKKCETNDAKSQSFCDDPYEAICAKSEMTFSKREERLQKLHQLVDKQAIQETIKHFKLNLKAVSEEELRKKITDTKYNEIESYLDERREEISNHQISSMGADTMLPYGQKVKEHLLAAINESTLSTNDKKRFYETIKPAQMYTSYELSNSNHNINKNGPSLEKLSENSTIICNSWFSLGAFHVSFRDEANPNVIKSGAVAICSTDLLSSNLSGKKEYYFANSCQSVGHEFGHLVSSRWEPNAYTKFYSCLKDNYSKDGVTSGGNLLSGQLEEITADYWGTQTVSHYLRSDGKNLKNEEKLDFLKATYGTYCGTDMRLTDNTWYLSGKTRIVLAGRDPGLRQAFGCSPIKQTVKPGCTLDGPAR